MYFTKNATPPRTRTTAVSTTFVLLVASAIFFAALCQVQAKTVLLTGTMQSTLGFSERYVARVPQGITSLTVNIPVATTITGYGWQQNLSNCTVHSSFSPTSAVDIADEYGNHYKVLMFISPPPGDIVITTDMPRISVSANLAGSVPRANFPLNKLPAEMNTYLQSSALIQSESPQIKSAAMSIIDGASDEATAAQRLAAWMFQKLSYASGSYIATTDAKWTLAHRTGQCGGWANLFVALARSSGIPARVADGYTLGGSLTYPVSRDSLDNVTVTSSSSPHAWVELWYPNAGWIPYEPQSSSAFLDSHHICFHAAPTSESTKPLLQWSYSPGTDGDVTYTATCQVSNLTDHCNVVYVGEDAATDDKILLARCLP